MPCLGAVAKVLSTEIALGMSVLKFSPAIVLCYMVIHPKSKILYAVLSLNNC